MPAALLIFVAQAYFLAAMDPWTPLAAALLAGAANLGGDIALVCAAGWGIAGAALATAAAQVRCPSMAPPLLPSACTCWARLCSYLSPASASAERARAAQLLTAGALLVALLRPLRPGSLAPGFTVQLRWRLPSLRAAGLFLKYAGPIVAVLMSKTVMYSALPCIHGKA